MDRSPKPAGKGLDDDRPVLPEAVAGASFAEQLPKERGAADGNAAAGCGIFYLNVQRHRFPVFSLLNNCYFQGLVYHNLAEMETKIPDKTDKVAAA